MAGPGVPIPIMRNSKDAYLPARPDPESAGSDLASPIDTVIRAKTRDLIFLNLGMEIPSGMFGWIAPRSSLSKRGIDIGGGIIDSSYRGDVGVIIINNGDKDFVIKKGDRIAQLIILPFVKPEFIEVDKLTSTARGTGGFGSTGLESKDNIKSV